MVQLKEEYPHHQIKQMNNAITEAEVKAYQELQTRDLSDEELKTVAGGLSHTCYRGEVIARQEVQLYGTGWWWW